MLGEAPVPSLPRGRRRHGRLLLGHHRPARRPPALRPWPNADYRVADGDPANNEAGLYPSPWSRHRLPGPGPGGRGLRREPAGPARPCPPTVELRVLAAEPRQPRRRSRGRPPRHRPAGGLALCTDMDGAACAPDRRPSSPSRSSSTTPGSRHASGSWSIPTASFRTTIASNNAAELSARGPRQHRRPRGSAFRRPGLEPRPRDRRSADRHRRGPQPRHRGGEHGARSSSPHRPPGGASAELARALVSLAPGQAHDRRARLDHRVRRRRHSRSWCEPIRSTLLDEVSETNNDAAIVVRVRPSALPNLTRLGRRHRRSSRTRRARAPPSTVSVLVAQPQPGGRGPLRGRGLSRRSRRRRHADRRGPGFPGWLPEPRPRSPFPGRPWTCVASQGCSWSPTRAARSRNTTRRTTARSGRSRRSASPTWC